MLLPGLVAAAVGYVIFVGFGGWGGLGSQALAVPGLPPYNGTHIYDLLVGVVIGVLAAARRHGLQANREATRRRQAPLGMPAVLILGGLAVGLAAQIADWLGATRRTSSSPARRACRRSSRRTRRRSSSILLLAKAIGYAICLGCGFRGGPVFPAIFLGVALAMFAVIWFDVSPTVAVAVGAAAGVAAAHGCS